MTAPFTPTITTPAQPGQLSNKRGANTGADALPISCIYSNRRGVADYAGNLRVLAQRSVVAGAPDTAPTIWDSDWVAAPPTTPVPGSLISTGGLATALYGGRIYAALLAATTSTPATPIAVWSAPVTGSSVGTWRQEATALPTASTGGGVSSMTVAAGFLYICDSNANILYAKINGDGSLGTWTTSPNKPATTGQLVGGNVGPTAAVPNQGFLMIFGSQGSLGVVAASTNVQNVGLNVDGSLQGWVAGTALPAQRAAMGLFYNQVSGYILVVGGIDNTATMQATVWHAPVTGLGAVGAWVTTDTALPLARRGVALAFNPATNVIYALGGDNAGSVNTNYSASVSTTGAIGGVWTAGTVLAIATAGAGAFIGANSNPVCVGGAITNVQAFFNGVWVSGPQTLAVGSLGVGASLVNNQDGTQTLTFNYGAFGPAQTVTLGDGDQVTLTIQMVDSQNGDPSPTSVTVLKIGQPPTVTGIAPTGATTDGRPLLSFNYNPGAGGDLELSYQVTVKDAAGNVLFDSGVRYDGLNSVQSLFAPYLLTSQTYTVAVTAISKDLPVAGSSATATGSITFTPTMTVPNTPSALVVTPNPSLGSCTLTWQNNASVTTPGGRVYYRRYGTVKWFLLADFSSITSAYTAMDQIALATAYDFAVSMVDNNNHVETALTSILAEDFERLSNGVTTLFRSLGTDATGTLNAWTVSSGVTIAANVMTVPAAGSAIAGHSDWGDGTFTVRGTWATGANGFLYWHYNNAQNSLVRLVYDGINLYMQKLVQNIVLGSSSIVAAALTNGTFYWFRISSTGTTYTATVFADAAGAIGAQIATVSWTVSEPLLQTGSIVIVATGATLTFGGAFAGVCTVSGPVPIGWTPNFVAGESAFCWSKAKAYAGNLSASIYNAHSSAQGYWSGPAIPASPPSCVIGEALWLATGSTPTAVGLTDGFGLYANAGGTATADSTWHTYTNTDVPHASTACLLLLYGAGTVYFDNCFVNPAAATNQTITPPAGNQGYAGFLHVAGQGTAHSVALLVQQSPDDKTKLDMRTSVPFQQLLPVARYGVAHYDEIKIKVFVQDVAHLRSLQDVINTAYAGNPLYYRDGFGTLITCTPMADHAVKYIPPLYREAEISLLQIANTFQPSVGQGSALGYLPQTLGSVAPLDSSEVIL